MAGHHVPHRRRRRRYPGETAPSHPAPLLRLLLPALFLCFERSLSLSREILEVELEIVIVLLKLAPPHRPRARQCWREITISFPGKERRSHGRSSSLKKRYVVILV